MINEKQTLKQLLANGTGGKILLLGKEGVFTTEEITRFLKPYHITTTKYLEEGVIGAVEHHRLNPVEEDISNDVYERNLPQYKLAEFEELMSQEIDDDSLLMAIKLGNDQDRLLRLLGNEHLDDTLFVKLLKLYRFNEEDEDNRQDRDVIMYTLRRYIQIKPNEEDLLYSYLTLRRLATEAEDPDLLDALMGFPNFTFLIRGKEKVTLKETVARNPHINEAVIRKLLALREKRIDIALAGNSNVPIEILKHLISKDNETTEMALAVNPGIDNEIFGALLKQSDRVVSLLLIHQRIDTVRLEQIRSAQLDPELFAVVGSNEKLENDVLASLFANADENLLEALSGNKTVAPAILEEIYQKDDARYYLYLSQNPSTPVWILEAIYEEYRDEETISAALAYNPATPEKILRELFNRDHFEINRGLATNASLPPELLDILKVDTRLQNDLAKNERLAESYESVLNQNKVMLNV